MFDIDMEILSPGVSVTDLCAEHSQIFSSRGELRRLIQGGGLSLNKIKIDNPEMIIDLRCPSFIVFHSLGKYACFSAISMIVSRRTTLLSIAIVLSDNNSDF